MKIDPRQVAGPVVAAVILALTVQQTVAALQISGSWRRGPAARVAEAADPYARLEGLLSRRPAAADLQGLRNPFGFVVARPAERPAAAANPTPRAPAVPPPPPRPVLTSIVWGGTDPRATVRYDGRDYSIRQNSLFAEFTVRTITQTQVVLERNSGETITLTLRPRGD